MKGFKMSNNYDTESTKPTVTDIVILAGILIAAVLYIFFVIAMYASIIQEIGKVL